MSQKPKVDPRAKRSRQWLQAAFMELIEEKGYSKTSITDIANRAGLSRPTFYLHFRSKEDILMDQVDVIIEPILQEFNELRKNSDIDQPGALAMSKLFEGIQNRLGVFRTLIHAGAERLLLELMHRRSLIYLKDLARRCEMDITPEVLDLSSWSMAGSFVGVVISWVEGEHSYTADELGEFTAEATRPLLRTAICHGELDYIFQK